ncbi:mixed lineage kinase domain-like protein [Amblyraja radiata]|uniref:mixed lineage kinase domain-like protein n=1 Tax=Amblyraja radiata TaxID=386614 RepID=UPI001401E665|nr:mixed lineage kinase domain-like protein [Amblyraja radiata]XP_032892007.1 mixed lineage kinase domain-like protein [Amblyraja radiata]
MEYIDKIFSAAKIIYSLCSEVKMNRKRCNRLKCRIEFLLQPVKAIKEEDLLDNLTNILKEMVEILERASDCVMSFTNKHWLSKAFKAFAIKEEFNHLNERLNDAAIALNLALNTEQTKMLLTRFKKEDDMQDTEEDQRYLNSLEKELEKALHSIENKIQHAMVTVNDNLVEMKVDLKDVKRIIESYQDKPSAPPVQEILELNRDDIEIETKLESKINNSKYYKGTLHKFPVAIKRFDNFGFSNVEEIRKTFHKEAETMKYFESPNIVRIYGICIDQSSSSPEFLIVMEYCEHGSLHSFLEGEWHLSWQSRVHMALDAACGLYRMHQSTGKFKLHCSIDSTRFLVDNGLRVKLGGMDLAKTETSIRRISTSQKSQLLPYISPQQMSNINYQYDKPCEVYSFGIVLWEIASCKTPFKDCSSQEIHKKVCEERVRESLPSDCPKELCELIDECRTYDPFERPKAGAIMDRLKNILKRITEITKEARD